MIQKSYDNKPSLYLIPTPIGNLEDMLMLYYVKIHVLLVFY